MSVKPRPKYPHPTVDGAPPIVSFVGHSGSGKTTFIEKLIPRLTDDGVKVAVIKHDVHGFEIDKPGKDTWRHKRAGAVATLISCANKIGLVMDADHDHQPHELAPMLATADLIITEGYKRASHPKIEVFRPDATGDTDCLCADDSQLIALISDQRLSIGLPVFGLDDIEAVSRFIQQHFKLGSAALIQ